jgi:hypothetical protein
LEFVGDDEECGRLTAALCEVEGIEVQKMVFEH